jgi:hypothetical protein
MYISHKVRLGLRTARCAVARRGLICVRFFECSLKLKKSEIPLHSTNGIAAFVCPPRTETGQGLVDDIRIKC